MAGSYTSAAGLWIGAGWQHFGESLKTRGNSYLSNINRRLGGLVFGGFRDKRLVETEAKPSDSKKYTTPEIPDR